VHSRQLKSVLGELAEQAALRLQACIEAGQEIPFELDSRSARRGGASLYCYRPLTGAYLAERFALLRALPAYAPAAAALGDIGGLDGYLVARGAQLGRPGPQERAAAALLAFLQDVFGEQSDFHLQAQRLERALAALESSANAAPTQVTLVATLHGLAISGEQLTLTSGLRIVRPEALESVPEQALSPVTGVERRHDAAAREEHLLIVYTAEDGNAGEAVECGVAVVKDLLRALRLFGDGRIALGPLAWTRVGGGPWSAFATGGGGHPYGKLLVSAEQEDELRAFCNLVSRRAPHEGPLAWALRRFEMGCERPDEYDALSDHLLALRGLLLADRVREGEASGLLASRIAALCAVPDEREALAERTLGAIALERDAIAGGVARHAGGLELVRESSNHLRALLRDVICGHLPSDLACLADELLSAERAPDEQPALFAERLGEQPVDDERQAGEILDVAI
jgi:hypothetical protein